MIVELQECHVMLVKDMTELSNNNCTEQPCNSIHKDDHNTLKVYRYLTMSADGEDVAKVRNTHLSL
jgi:hypothetical protein